MGKSSRDKGARGEREVAAIFRAAGFDVNRVPNSGGLRLKGDLYGAVPIHVEVKRTERLDLHRGIRQAQLESDGRPFWLVHRRNGTQWFVTMPLAQAVGMLT
jgi:Holliday junction resolvase